MSSPPTSAWVTIAPTLIIGFRGRPSSPSEILWKASPDGSTPTRSITVRMPRSLNASAYTNGLAIDWMVKGCLSPMT